MKNIDKVNEYIQEALDNDDPEVTMIYGNGFFDGFVVGVIVMLFIMAVMLFSLH